jgi:hypothetical protein
MVVRGGVVVAVARPSTLQRPILEEQVVTERAEYLVKMVVQAPRPLASYFLLLERMMEEEEEEDILLMGGTGQPL